MDFFSKFKKSRLDRFWLAFSRGSKPGTKEADEALGYAAQTNKLWRADYLLRVCKANAAANHNFALRWAANGGFVEMMSMLIDAGADVNAKEGEALIRAIGKKHDAAALLLLERGANPGFQEAQALEMAHAAQNLQLVKRMLASPFALEKAVTSLLRQARENRQENLAHLYEDYLKNRREGPRPPPAFKH